MFGTKAKKESTQTRSTSESNTMAVVSSKMDALQDVLEQEQQASASTPADDNCEPLQNSIGKGTIIEGNVHAQGDLRIEGLIKGDVTTKTKLIVGSNAVIEGNILAQHAEIAGRVQGTVKALGLLVINSSGTILGDVITKDLNVESGSTFSGRLQVGGSVSSTPIEIPKVNFSAPVAAPVATPVASVFGESLFDSPAPSKKPSHSVVEKATVVSAKSELDKAAEQLAANLSRSAMLH